ncbi:N-6 DNA methylase [Microbispora cellulosiformans]|uniref:N-6 DNA methylase n=1 Tax=Microbispora cellulosiformans TaxID=2614688 RepID=A0A5J5JVR5_9ACTN|nr:N-6 DNA methylase [Microbispora cellulosiformans]KAA9374846.1 N-6 DNA methylase [Microbispora cellulosiformans]
MSKKASMNGKNTSADTGSQALVTSAEVSRIAGVSRSVVANWRKRYEDFPQPAEDGPLFRLSEIEQWLAGHAKKKTTKNRAVVRPELRLWHALDTIGQAEGGLAFAARFLAAFTKVGGKSKDANAVLKLLDSGDPICKLPAEQLAPIVEEMLRLSNEKGAEKVLEELVTHYAQSGTAAQYFTPKAVTALMVRLIGDAPTRVLDPACGTGSLLAAVAQRYAAEGAEAPRLLGQEIDPNMVSISSSLLALCGFSSDIRQGDSLRKDCFSAQQVDAVVSNPPFGDRDWGFDDLVHDVRWHFGRPPRPAPELAWLQHAYAHLAPGGRGIILMPGSASASHSGRSIRRELVRQGALEAIISLPRGQFSGIHASFQINLWVLHRPHYGELPPSRILLIDGSYSGRNRELDSSTVEGIVQRCEEFRRDSTAADEVGFSRAVPAVQLMDDAVDLTPAIHIIQSASDPVDAVGRFIDAAHRLAASVRKVGSINLESVIKKEVAQPPLVTIGTLAEEGLLRIIRGYRPLLRTQGQSTGNDLRLLRGRDLVRPGGEPEFIEANSLPDAPELTRPGDVAIAELVSDRVVAVVLEEGGLLPASGVLILRAAADSFNSYFIAGFLRSATNSRFLRSGRAHLDVRRLQIPRLAVETQNRIGALLQALEVEEREILRAGVAIDELRSALLAGLLGGTMTVAADGDTP